MNKAYQDAGASATYVMSVWGSFSHSIPTTAAARPATADAWWPPWPFRRQSPHAAAPDTTADEFYCPVVLTAIGRPGEKSDQLAVAVVPKGYKAGMSPTDTIRVKNAHYHKAVDNGECWRLFRYEVTIAANNLLKRTGAKPDQLRLARLSGDGGSVSRSVFKPGDLEPSKRTAGGGKWAMMWAGATVSTAASAAMSGAAIALPEGAPAEVDLPVALARPGSNVTVSLPDGKLEAMEATPYGKLELPSNKLKPGLNRLDVAAPSDNSGTTPRTYSLWAYKHSPVANVAVCLLILASLFFLVRISVLHAFTASDVKLTLQPGKSDKVCLDELVRMPARGRYEKPADFHAAGGPGEIKFKVTPDGGCPKVGRLEATASPDMPNGQHSTTHRVVGPLGGEPGNVRIIVGDAASLRLLRRSAKVECIPNSAKWFAIPLASRIDSRFRSDPREFRKPPLPSGIQTINIVGQSTRNEELVVVPNSGHRSSGPTAVTIEVAFGTEVATFEVLIEVKDTCGSQQSGGTLPSVISQPPVGITPHVTPQQPIPPKVVVAPPPATAPPSAPPLPAPPAAKTNPPTSSAPAARLLTAAARISAKVPRGGGIVLPFAAVNVQRIDGRLPTVQIETQPAHASASALGQFIIVLPRSQNADIAATAKTDTFRYRFDQAGQQTYGEVEIEYADVCQTRFTGVRERLIYLPKGRYLPPSSNDARNPTETRIHEELGRMLNTFSTRIGNDPQALELSSDTCIQSSQQTTDGVEEMIVRTGFKRLWELRRGAMAARPEAITPNGVAVHSVNFDFFAELANQMSQSAGDEYRVPKPEQWMAGLIVALSSDRWLVATTSERAAKFTALARSYRQELPSWIDEAPGTRRETRYILGPAPRNEAGSWITENNRQTDLILAGVRFVRQP